MGKLLSNVVDVKVTGEGAFEGDLQNKNKEEETRTLEPVNTPHRRLEQLALHYVINHTTRIFLEDETKSMGTQRESKTPAWHDPTSILKTPRSLAFFDFPSQEEAEREDLPETCLVPTAAEFENGEVVLLFKNLRFGDWSPPTYPKEADSRQALREQRKAYWREYFEHYDVTSALTVLEEAASDVKGRLRWIDFRAPLTKEGDSLHLHIQPSGKYDTGTFAYNMIKRGHKYGLRIVGMLKSQPDLNVLAVFEK